MITCIWWKAKNMSFSHLRLPHRTLSLFHLCVQGMIVVVPTHSSFRQGLLLPDVADRYTKRRLIEPLNNGQWNQPRNTPPSFLNFTNGVCVCQTNTLCQHEGPAIPSGKPFKHLNTSHHGYRKIANALINSSMYGWCPSNKRYLVRNSNMTSQCHYFRTMDPVRLTLVLIPTLQMASTLKPIAASIRMWIWHLGTINSTTPR